METDSSAGRRRARYGLLLGAIILAFSIEGTADPNQWQQIVISALLSVTLLLALWTADAKPRIMRPAVLIVACLFILSVAETIYGHTGGGATRLANALLVLVAPPAVVVGVVRNLRAKQAVTLEAVFGVLCVYILLGMFFSWLYGAIDRLGGHPFFAGGQAATAARCLYFSFASLTTVGYGDLTARTNVGHTLSVSEALLGQVYLVTVVSLIVANLGRGTPASRLHQE
jgi:Ion channel